MPPMNPLSYIDSNGNDHFEKVEREVTNYGKIYDSLNAAISGTGEKAVKDEEVVCGLRIVEEATKAAKAARPLEA